MVTNKKSIINTENGLVLDETVIYSGKEMYKERWLSEYPKQLFTLPEDVEVVETINTYRRWMDNSFDNKHLPKTCFMDMTTGEYIVLEGRVKDMSDEVVLLWAYITEDMNYVQVPFEHGKMLHVYNSYVKSNLDKVYFKCNMLEVLIRNKNDISYRQDVVINNKKEEV